MFISHQPIKIQFINDDRVIVLTKKKLIFMNLEIMESSVEMPLVGVDPQNFFFNPHQMEVLVQTISTIEIYSCDWKTHIQLKRVITLNKKSVSWVCYDERGWNIYGSQQEDKTKVSFYPVKSYMDDALAHCYVQDKQYLITEQFLYKSQQMNERKAIKFSHHQTIIRDQQKISMFATNQEESFLDILCISAKYVLLINQYTVLRSFQFGNILFSEHGLLVCGKEDDDTIDFHHVEKDSIFSLGHFRKERGKLVAANLCQFDIRLLTYRNRQLSKQVFEVSDDRSQNVANILGPEMIQSPHKITNIPIKDIPQPIAEHEEEEMSPILPKKPKIRDIPVFDGEEELAKDVFENKDSDVLSQTGNNHLINKQPIKQLGMASPSIHDIIQTSTEKRQEEFMDSIQEKKLPQKVSSEKDKTQPYEDQNNKGVMKGFKIKKSRSEIKVLPHEIHINTIQYRDKSSDQSSSRLDQFPETPAFGDSHQPHWDHFPTSLIPPKVQQVEEIDESVVIPESQSLNKSFKMEESEKVKAFTPEETKITMSLARQIENTSYIQLMSKIQRDEQKFQQLMNQFLWEIAQQKNCSIFFANHIKAFNSEMLKDTIQRMFTPYLYEPQAKVILTNALKQFKLKQVPKHFLNFDDKLLSILIAICPELYISDICTPSVQGTLKYIMDYYFQRKSELRKKVWMEDEEVDISHARNMLNVLFYLNQSFQFKSSDVLRVYFEKVVNEKCWSVIKKLKKMNIFEVIGEPEQILDFIMIDYLDNLLLSELQLEELKQLWDVLGLINLNLMHEYQMKVEIIRDLQSSFLKFDRSYIVSIRKKKKAQDIFVFLQSLINENPSSVLLSLRMARLYRSLYWLQEQQVINFCTYEYVDLIKKIAEKLLSDDYIYDAFKLLDTVSRKLRKSYFIGILTRYFNGAYLKRIITQYDFNLKQVFPEIFSNHSISVKQIKLEKFEKPEKSKYFSCPWAAFRHIIQKHMKIQPQLSLLIYLDLPTADQYFSHHLDPTMRSNFLFFIEQMQEYINESYTRPIHSEESNNPKAITSILLFSQDQFLQSQNFTATQRAQENMLLLDHFSERKQQTFQSMALIDSLQNVQTRGKANSEQKSSTKKKKKKKNQQYEDAEIRRLKFLVHQDEILDQLEQIYYTKNKLLFLKALSIIDQQKIALYNVEAFRLLVTQKLNFEFELLIPFDLFIFSDKDARFKTIKKKIEELINIDNFWLITEIIDLFYGKRRQVYHLFLNKVIYYYRTDQLFPVVRFLLSQVSPLEAGEKKDLVKFSFNHKMNKINDILKKH